MAAIVRAHDFTADRDAGTKILAARVDTELDNLIALLDGSSSYDTILQGKIQIRDTDADTKIQIEESADEDIIRMDTRGTEVFQLQSDGILTLAQNSSCKVTLAGAQTEATGDGAFDKILFDTELWDTRGEFASNKYTCAIAGKYLIILCVEWSSMADGKVVKVSIYKDGVSIAQVSQTTGVANNPRTCLSTVLDLAASEYIEGFASQNSGGSEQIAAGEEDTYLLIHKIA